jgi:hypothetical protein
LLTIYIYIFYFILFYSTIVSGNPPIFTATRRILCELEIERVRVKPNQELILKSFQAHLFNDIFIYSTTTLSGKLKLHQMVDLKTARFDRNSIGGSQTGFTVFFTEQDELGEHFRILENSQLYGKFMLLVAQQLEAQKANRTELRTATIAKKKNILGNLPGVQANKLGIRGQVIYKFLLEEMQFAENVAMLNLVMIQPLLDASKGAPLRANDGSGSSILFNDNSTNASNAKIQIIRDALKEADVLLCLRSVEGLTIAVKEFAKSLETSVSSGGNNNNNNNNTWSESVCIGDVFRAVSARTYYDQLKSYTAGLQALIRIIRTAPFAQFYRDVELILSSAPGTLEEKLDSIRQRIKLLLHFLQELLRITNQSHPDFTPLTSSQQTLDTVDKEITELLRIKRNFEELLEIQNSLMTMSNEPLLTKLASMERTFIKQGDLKKICRRKDKLFRFWLLSDYLLYGGHLGGDKFSFNRALELSAVSVQLITNDGTNTTKNALEIRSKEKSFIVIAATTSLRDEWYEAIEKASQSARTHAGIVDTENETAPVWAADNTSDHCTQCDKLFSMWNRKHHCRKCGALVCSAHLNQKELLPHIHPTQKQKICDQCVKGLSIIPPSMTAATTTTTTATPAASSTTATTTIPAANTSTTNTTTTTPATTTSAPAVKRPSIFSPFFGSSKSTSTTTNTTTTTAAPTATATADTTSAADPNNPKNIKSPLLNTNNNTTTTTTAPTNKTTSTPTAAPPIIPTTNNNNNNTTTSTATSKPPPAIKITPTTPNPTTTTPNTTMEAKVENPVKGLTRTPRKPPATNTTNTTTTSNTTTNNTSDTITRVKRK